MSVSSTGTGIYGRGLCLLKRDNSDAACKLTIHSFGGVAMQSSGMPNC